jgi:hypothetical protein
MLRSTEFFSLEKETYPLLLTSTAPALPAATLCTRVVQLAQELTGEGGCHLQGAHICPSHACVVCGEFGLTNQASERCAFIALKMMRL